MARPGPGEGRASASLQGGPVDESDQRDASSCGAYGEAAYSRWAPVYDLIFDLPFHPGRAAAARAAADAAGPGGEILVVGVGTGLELPLLPGNVLVTGIDISAPMLRAARARVERRRWRRSRACR